MPMLSRLFNIIFNKGTFPYSWSEGIVILLYKKGDASNSNNHRGIYMIFNCVFLMCADDAVLLSETAEGVQEMHAVFCLHTTKWNNDVIIDKIKIVILNKLAVKETEN